MRSHKALIFSLRALLLCLAAGAANADVLISVSTSNNTLSANATATLTALVTGAANANVTWSASPVVAGATLGPNSNAITGGLTTNTYKAPSIITTSQVVVISATSVADPTQVATARITLTPNVTVTVNPSAVNMTAGQSQQFSAVVSGISATALTWSISPQVGSIDPAIGLYTAPAVIASVQSVRVTATLNFDTQVTGTATVTLQSPTVSISPTTATLTSGATQQFTATVSGVSNSAVTWSLSPALGSIDATGLFTAPTFFSVGQKISVIATSVADASKSATATVTMGAGSAVTIAISPTAVTLNQNGTQQFTATVANTTNTAVLWSINPVVGSIDTNGLYTAPSTITTARVTVTATSLADSIKTANAVVTLSTLVDIGSGAPNPGMQQQFISAYNRGNFRLLTSLPPLAAVRALGATGYVQEFPDALKTAGVRYALATASATTSVPDSEGVITSVVQIWSDVYAYYLTIGAGTAGYPFNDTLNCPFFDAQNSCTYQFFDKNYLLFAYRVATATGQNFFVRNAFYTEWNSLGGIGGLGRPLTGEVSITASTKTTAVSQTYVQGVTYSITSGANRGQTHGVGEPFYDLYVAKGGAAGPCGLPVTEALNFTSGVRRQSFEGCTLELGTDGTPPTNQLPVASVALAGGPAVGTTATLSVGQSVTLLATVTDTAGTVVTDRGVSWSSSNGQVVSIQANGATAVVTAVGPGTANVTASSGGVASPKAAFLVNSTCCSVGDGAPATVQAAFQSAVARNKLTVQLPVAAPASRMGGGYVQTVQAGGAAYLIAQSDQVGTAYVVTGALLAAYQALGGPAGTLGYPLSDATAGGMQRFESAGALAGNPVRLVAGQVYKKWALLGYETGTAGSPTGDAAAFDTFGANSGTSQDFANGTILAATAGPRAGQSYFVSGPILAAFKSNGGASGTFGMPVTDEFVSGGVHQQNFEGGTISYATGATTAQVQPAPKTPAVIVAPASISAGSRARLAISGFPDGSTLRVSISGQPDFLVTTANGAYSWEMFVPLAAQSGAMTIRAVDTKGASTASGTLTVKGFADNRLQISKTRGDNQTGLPGASLPVPVEVALLDSSGAAVTGALVTFQGSPGVQLSAASVVSDSNGRASVVVRLPAAEGTAAVTVNAPAAAQTPVTFYAVATSSKLNNYPAPQQAGSALVAAVASILRYRQNRGEVGSPNGLADASSLNQFLTYYCAPDAAGVSVCDGYLSNPASGEKVVNLWRAAEFTGGLDAVPVAATIAAVADLLAQGEPMLLSLALSRNGATAGGNFVVATGIGADGSILIQDPNPAFAKSSLTDYLNGFTAAGGAWKATLLGAMRFAVRSPAATRFLVGAVSQPAALLATMALSATSTAGACGTPFSMMDSVDPAGAPPAAGPLVTQISVCDGQQPIYEVAMGTSQPYRAFLTDLAKGGSTYDLSAAAPAVYAATRPLLALALAPESANFTAAGVVNAATFTAGIAPGGLMSIFGTGLAGSGGATSVDIDGIPAAVLSATAFQVNAVVPAGIAPGDHTVRVKSPFGTAQQQVTVSAVAPAIFLVGSPATGAVVNPDNTVNGAANPLARGQYFVIYATGLGNVTKQGQLSVTTLPVTVVVNGTELATSFAGLAPGFSGLYQVNVAIPASLPPGLGLSLTLNQGGKLSNTVIVAIE